MQAWTLLLHLLLLQLQCEAVLVQPRPFLVRVSADTTQSEVPRPWSQPRLTYEDPIRRVLEDDLRASGGGIVLANAGGSDYFVLTSSVAALSKTRMVHAWSRVGCEEKNHLLTMELDLLHYDTRPDGYAEVRLLIHYLPWGGYDLSSLRADIRRALSAVVGVLVAEEESYHLEQQSLHAKLVDVGDETTAIVTLAGNVHFEGGDVAYTSLSITASQGGISAHLTAISGALCTIARIYGLETRTLTFASNQHSASLALMGVGKGDRDWAEARGLDGSQQVIAISDTGIDMGHCFFADANTPPAYDTYVPHHRKVVYYDTKYGDGADNREGHGTHVCGTAAGNGMGRYTHERGLAPESKIFFTDLSKEDGMHLNVPYDVSYALLEAPYNKGARIFSMSWGSRSSVVNSYNAVAVSIDGFTYKHPEALVVVAAGNSGNCGALSLVSAATAKNALVVGSAISVRSRAKKSYNGSYFKWLPSPTECNVSYFSSHGPAFDGRSKPDVVATGDPVRSAKAGSGCGMTDKAGTSMATPVVTGCAALIRQYFVEGKYPNGKLGDEPTGVLLKAMLIHSARHLARYYDSQKHAWLNVPSSLSAIEGFGAITLSEVMDFGEGDRRTLVFDRQRHVEQGKSRTYCFVVDPEQSQSIPFRATLVYYDFPSAVGQSRVLRTKLNLQAIYNEGKSWRFGNSQEDQAPADVFNTVESISIHPSTGHVTVVVHHPSGGASVMYALVVTGAKVKTADDSTQCPQTECRCDQDNCNESTRECQCKGTGLVSADCKVPLCTYDCSINGKCVVGELGTPTCQCDDGYCGTYCQEQCRQVPLGIETMIPIPHYPVVGKVNTVTSVTHTDKTRGNYLSITARSQRSYGQLLDYSVKVTPPNGDTKSWKQLGGISVALRVDAGDYKMKISDPTQNFKKRMWCVDPLHFAAEVTSTPRCLDNCSGHGTCAVREDTPNGVKLGCDCDKGWETEKDKWVTSEVIECSNPTGGCTWGTTSWPCPEYSLVYRHAAPPSDLAERWEIAKKEWFGNWDSNSILCKEGARQVFCSEHVPSCYWGKPTRICESRCREIGSYAECFRVLGGQWPDMICSAQPDDDCTLYPYGLWMYVCALIAVMLLCCWTCFCCLCKCICTRVRRRIFKRKPVPGELLDGGYIALYEGSEHDFQGENDRSGGETEDERQGRRSPEEINGEEITASPPAVPPPPSGPRPQSVTYVRSSSHLDGLPHGENDRSGGETEDVRQGRRSPEEINREEITASPPAVPPPPSGPRPQSVTYVRSSSQLDGLPHGENDRSGGETEDVRQGRRSPEEINREEITASPPAVPPPPSGPRPQSVTYVRSSSPLRGLESSSV